MYVNKIAARPINLCDCIYLFHSIPLAATYGRGLLAGLFREANECNGLNVLFLFVLLIVPTCKTCTVGWSKCRTIQKLRFKDNSFLEPWTAHTIMYSSVRRSDPNKNAEDDNATSHRWPVYSSANKAYLVLNTTAPVVERGLRSRQWLLLERVGPQANSGRQTQSNV